MILFIDIGNTFIKWGFLHADSVFAGDSGLPALEMLGETLHAGQDINHVLDKGWSELAVPSKAWMASVAGSEVNQAVTDWIAGHWHITVSAANSQQSQLDLVNAYTEPARLGIDRWLAMLAVSESWTGASCIIDCGSAITIDAIDASAQHLGGLILPGLQMMQDALYKGADGVERGERGEAQPGMLFATDTVSAVEAGCLYAVVTTIDRVVSDMTKELDEPVTCILTGGDAEKLLPLLSIPVSHEPQLVLQGLVLYAADVTGDMNS